MRTRGRKKVGKRGGDEDSQRHRPTHTDTQIVQCEPSAIAGPAERDAGLSQSASTSLSLSGALVSFRLEVGKMIFSLLVQQRDKVREGDWNPHLAVKSLSHALKNGVLGLDDLCSKPIGPVISRFS